MPIPNIVIENAYGVPLKTIAADGVMFVWNETVFACLAADDPVVTQALSEETEAVILAYNTESGSICTFPIDEVVLEPTKAEIVITL